MDGVIDENRPSLKPVRDLLPQGINSLRSRDRFRRQIQRSTRRRAKPNLAGFHQNRNRHGNLRRARASFTAAVFYHSSRELGIGQASKPLLKSSEHGLQFRAKAYRWPTGGDGSPETECDLQAVI